MDHLDRLESQSIYILREAFDRLDRLDILWSIGKDSNVMVWLDDDSEDSAATMAALDRRLRQAESLVMLLRLPGPRRAAGREPA